MRTSMVLSITTLDESWVLDAEPKKNTPIEEVKMSMLKIIFPFIFDN
jgi:hypothetical protein